MTTDPISDAQAEKLLPEWETIESPCHTKGPFYVPVYAKDCRPAVSAALSELRAENERLKAGGCARDQRTTQWCQIAEEMRAENEGKLKDAFVAGCCAVLKWTHSRMPQDDLDEAGYDYVTSIRDALSDKKEQAE